jgi:poly(hydroxyalkanoate) depolymerase family esterase
MTDRIQNAVADALARLRTSDVAGATSAIREALSSASLTRSGIRVATSTNPFSDQAGRGLAGVLGLLKAQRSAIHAASARPDRAPAQENPRFIWRTQNSAARAMNYKLYVPECRHREPALLLMLHGCKQDPDDFARGTRMNDLADEFGLIVAYPHQPHSANAQGCWNWFDRRHQSAGAGEPAMLVALARTLSEEFSIAPERVFAAGLSAGAAMTDVLAETYPEVFSRVGLHSGLPHLAAHDVMSAFAAMKGDGKLGLRSSNGQTSRKIIIHGSTDPIVHPSNSDAIFERMHSRHRGTSIIVSESENTGRKATRQILIGTSGDALAEHLLIQGAGHAWSGGDAGGSYADPLGPDASREMVKFFLRG